MKLAKLLILFLLPLFLSSTCEEQREKRVLVFSKTEGYRHESIPDGIAAIKKLGRENGFKVFATDDATLFKEEQLKNFSTVVFLNTTGDVLDHYQEAEFERFIQAGGGYVGVHSAADTEYDWAWYGKLVGGYFQDHPDIQSAGIDLVEAKHPATKMLPKRWERTDEWYNYKSLNPKTTVLLNLDESSYEGGKNGENHPTAWCHEYDGGRAFYTGGGHTKEAFQEPLFLQHLVGGILWSIGENQLNYSKSITYKVPPEDRFVRSILAENLNEPMEMDIFDNGDIIFVERKGAIKLWSPKAETVNTIVTLPVWSELEDGLMGVAIDPNYEESQWVYVYYAPLEGAPRNQIARFKFDGNTWDLESEQVILEVATQRDECCHSGGCLEFDADGNLYLSVGDNTNPFNSDGFSPIDERVGRSAWDAQRSSANTNDLRGKILRIHPEADGSYTIPKGNLFPEGTPKTRPEIFVMGCRNPFRLSIDQKRNWVYWGDVGPDAGKDGEARGPKGYDEINQAKTAGFYGWPYFRGDDKTYHDYDFSQEKSGDLFNPEAPINNSPNNTGLQELPPFQSSMIWYSYDDSQEFSWVGTGGKNPMAGPVFHASDFANTESRFPDYFNDKLFVYEWMRHWIFVVKKDSLGNFVKADPFMPNAQFSRPMDMIFDKDGNLYVLEYGETWFEKNLDARLSKIEYIRGNRRPIPKIEVDKTIGGAPLTVQFSAANSIDYDGDRLRYEWQFERSSGIKEGVFVTHTFKYPGNYNVKLRAIEPNGNAAVTTQIIRVGNTPPEVNWQLAGNQTFYWDDRKIDYQVVVNDVEDGSTADGSIPAKAVSANINYLAQGQDLTQIAQGHKKAGETPSEFFHPGKQLIEQSDCSSCHAEDRRVNGPSYLEIATQYADQTSALDYLSNKIIEGGGGVWGEKAMAAHPQLSRETTEEMVRYIFSINSRNTTESSHPIAGFYATDTHLKDGSEGSYVFMATYADRGNSNTPSITRQQTLVLRHPKIEAEKATIKSVGVRANDFDEKTDIMGGLRHGQFFGFEGIDLTNIGEINLQFVAQNGGTIEIRKDSENGVLLGVVEINSSEGNEKLEQQRILLEPVEGIHDLYFVGKNETDQGELIGMVDWVWFEQRGAEALSAQ